MLFLVCNPGEGCTALLRFVDAVMGTLSIELLSAEGLLDLDEDKGGKGGDPYCVFVLADQSVVSMTKRDTTSPRCVHASS